MCSANAAFNVACNVRPELQGQHRASQRTFATLLPGTMDAADDPSVEDVQRVLSDLEIDATKRLFHLEGSPHLLISPHQLLLLVRLQLWYEGEADPGFHLTVYHGPSGAILDPDASTCKSTVVTDTDRIATPPTNRKQRAAANRKAMRAFHASFPVPCKIEIAQVWQCQRV